MTDYRRLRRIGEVIPDDDPPRLPYAILIAEEYARIQRSRDYPYRVTTLSELIALIEYMDEWFNNANEIGSINSKTYLVPKCRDVHRCRLEKTPGAQRLTLYCNREWGEDITIKNLKKIRGRLGEGADEMSLVQVYDALEGIIDSDDPSAERQSLTETQRYLIDAALALGAVDEGTRRSKKEIAKKAGIPIVSGSTNQALAELVRRRFTASKTGRGGGIWLTDKGRLNAKPKR